MLGRLRKTVRSKHARTAFLLVMSLAFLGAYLWLPAFAGEAETAATAAHGGGESFKFFRAVAEPREIQFHGEAGLITVLIIAIIGLAYAVDARPKCPSSRRHQEDEEMPMRSRGRPTLTSVPNSARLGP